MKRYDEKILGILLDKYERSLLYTGKNQINQKISVAIQKKLLPEYFDESALQFEIIHEQLEALEAQGYIRLIWKNKKRGHILEKCELVIPYVDASYVLLGRKPKYKKEQEILNICELYYGKEQVLDLFLDWIKARIIAGETVRKYVDVNEAKEFRILCEVIFGILTNKEACFLRQFSIRHFSDSKVAEKEIGRATHVIAEFSDLVNLQKEEILEEYNIYRNPSWMMLKGNASFFIGEGEEIQTIDVSKFYGGLGISNQDMERIIWNQEVLLHRVVTIENLTSFHQISHDQMQKEKALYVYLGGYHNRIKREFLKRLYASYPKAEYVHFGDIDCGGFRIWKDLCVKTKIPFQVCCMDIETYETYLKWGRSLSETDRKTLEAMMQDSFFANQIPLFQKMLEYGVKLEQECIERS